MGPAWTSVRSTSHRTSLLALESLGRGNAPPLRGDGGRQLDLDVVRVAERQNVDPERRQGFDLPVRHPSPVEDLHRPLQLVAARDVEAQVVETDAVLVEAI